MLDIDNLPDILTKQDLKEIAQMCVTFYGQACKQKDQARRSPEYELLFLYAYQGNLQAKKCAEVLSVRLNDAVLCQNYRALTYYYDFEAMNCQIPILRNKDIKKRNSMFREDVKDFAERD